MTDLLRRTILWDMHLYVTPELETLSEYAKLEVTPEQVHLLTRLVITNVLDWSKRHGVHVKGTFDNSQ